MHVLGRQRDARLQQAFRKKGHANIAAARGYYARDDQRILTLYGYA